ncbi:hypothetical protein D3C80_1536690 [compost metagenome]
MHRRQRQHGNGDRRTGHIDGRTQRDRNRIGVFVQIQFFAQLHIHRNIGGRAAGEERGHAAFTQAGEHQRIRIATDFPENDQRVQHQCDQQHTADQHHQQLSITPQRAEAGFGQRRSHQAEDAKRGTADHRTHHHGDCM